MLKLAMQKVKWIAIYIVGVIIGFFAGGNILGAIFDKGQSEDFMPLFYGALLGIVISIIAITIIKIWPAKKTKNRNQGLPSR